MALLLTVTEFGPILAAAGVWWVGRALVLSAAVLVGAVAEKTDGGGRDSPAQNGADSTAEEDAGDAETAEWESVLEAKTWCVIQLEGLYVWFSLGRRIRSGC